MWIAQYITGAARYAVDANDGDADSFTTSLDLAYRWRSETACKAWIRKQGQGSWMAVKYLIHQP